MLVDTCSINNISSPATVYVIIAVIMTVIFMIVYLFRNPTNNFTGLISWLCIQIVCILICFIIIYGVCSFDQTVAWVFVIVIALSALSTFISLVFNQNKYIVAT